MFVGISRRTLRASRAQLDREVAVERLRDTEQRVDARRPTTGLEPCDRRLSRPGQLGELLLREPERLPLVGDLLGDLREEPALVGVDMGKPLAELFERLGAHLAIIAKPLLHAVAAAALLVARYYTFDTYYCRTLFGIGK